MNAAPVAETLNAEVRASVGIVGAIANTIRELGGVRTDTCIPVLWAI